MMWQTINTIPKDGTKVDLLDKNGVRLIDVFWKDTVFCREICGIIYSGSNNLSDYTHWMPSPSLPEPPKKRAPREVWIYERPRGGLEDFIARIYDPENPGIFGGSGTKKIVKFREVMEDD